MHLNKTQKIIYSVLLILALLTLLATKEKMPTLVYIGIFLLIGYLGYRVNRKDTTEVKGNNNVMGVPSTPIEASQEVKKSDAEIVNATDDSPPSENPIWYNNNLYLWISLLFWPAWAYGLYKTSLYTSKTKKVIVASLLGVLFVIGLNMGPNVESDGSIKFVESYIKDHHNVTSGNCSYEGLSWGKLMEGKNGKYAIEHSYLIKCYGNRVKFNSTFIISKDGKRVEDAWEDIVY